MTALLLAMRFGVLFAGSDPLEPIEQDPDVVRDEACRLVSRDPSVCATPDTTPPNTSSDSRGLTLDWFGTLLWILFAVVLIALLVLLVRYLMVRTAGRRRKQPKADDDEDDLDQVEQAAVAIDRSREPTNWRDEADEHRRAGRYREALRCRYRALVGDLARRGLIDEIPGRTTGEERTQLHHVQPDASSPFTFAADLFDEAWYGNVAVDADDDERFQAFERDVLAKSSRSQATARK